MAVIDWDQFNENFQYYDRDTIVEVIQNFFEEFEGAWKCLRKISLRMTLNNSLSMLTV